MSRLKVALLAFCCVGGLAAVSVSDRGAFVVSFVGLMFGGIAAAVAIVGVIVGVGLAVVTGWGGAVPLWGGDVAKKVSFLEQGGSVWVFKLVK